jgi:glycosyltransferase involved in cell wall biosynthesis
MSLLRFLRPGVSGLKYFWTDRFHRQSNVEKENATLTNQECCGMKHVPLVSILIPAYNKEEWIAETIESALAQTWNNKELIIIDDGSTDSTLEVIRRFESKIVKVFPQENQGVCAARNKAYSMAQGSYIQWLDADDLLHPQKIEAQMARSSDGDDSLCLRTAAFGSFYFRKEAARFQVTRLWQDLSPADWIITSFKERAWMNPTAWLVSRRLSDLAGPWDRRLALSGADDGEYIFRVIAKSRAVEFCPKAKCYYRIGNLSSLNHNSERALNSLFLALTLGIQHLLSIENSTRSKEASLQYLQDWFHLFYSGPTELIGEMQAFATGIGGQLIEPQFTWKYALIHRVCGWGTANTACKYLRLQRMLAERALDQLLHLCFANRRVLRRRVFSPH